MLENERDVEVDMSAGNPGSFHINFLDMLGSERGKEGTVREALREGSVRLEAASRAAAGVRQGLEEIEKGMDSMAIGSSKGSVKMKASRNGLRDMTNRR